MSGTGEIHLNDIGTRIFVRFTDCGSPFDFTALTTIATLALCLKPPINPTKTFPMTFSSTPTLTGSTFAGDGSDGWAEYTVVSSATWDEVGSWQLQGLLIGNALEFFHSEIKTFSVFGNICL